MTLKGCYLAGDIYAEIVRLRAAGENAALATIIEVRGSIPAYETAKLLVRADGTMLGTIGGGCVEAEVWQAAREALREEKSRRLVFHLNRDASEESGLICGGTLEIFIEPVVAPPMLFCFGAGHVCRAVATAAAAGFGVTVCDSRPAYVTAERFPGADLRPGEYAEVMPTLAPRANAYVVIATPGHREDMNILQWACATPARYIGMIGSKRKVISTYRELLHRGVSAEALERVYAPMGLEIGAIAPEEIGVAVVAEMIAVRRHAPAPHMKLAKMPALAAAEMAPVSSQR
ncbi:MAG: XdhC family protein [Terriglobales bacterium]